MTVQPEQMPKAVKQCSLLKQILSDCVAKVKGDISVTTSKLIWSFASTIMRWGNKNVTFHVSFCFITKRAPFQAGKKRNFLPLSFVQAFNAASLRKKKKNQKTYLAAESMGIGS